MTGYTARARVTTNIVGGLGNQLFLVANLLAASRRSGVPAVLARSPWSSSCEAPRPTYWGSLFESLGEHGVSFVTDDAMAVELRSAVSVPEQRPVAPVRLDPSRNCLYNMVGFFQSDGYFADLPLIGGAVPQRLRDEAAACLRDNYSGAHAGGAAPHLVALHLRRGDYVRHADVFEQLALDGYYEAAVRQLLGGQLLHPPAALPLVRLLLFCEEADDAAQACAFFCSRYPGLSVAHVHGSNEARAPTPAARDDGRCPREVLELLMMAQCDDVVMANSTFSWWGAYLNQRPLRRVVAPSLWFVQHPYPQSNHLYCDNWLLV